MSVAPSSMPLGVKSDVPLTEEQLSTLQLLQDYDLSPVRNRLLRDGYMPSDVVDKAMLEFRRYVAMCYLEPRPLLMYSSYVDHVWHGCLMFTRLYADFCEQTLGWFLHHDPLNTPDPNNDPERVDFVEAYEQLFGPLSYLWRRHAACS